MPTVLEQIQEQIEAAKDDLARHGPPTINWFDRCKSTAEELVPWLQGAAKTLIEYMEGVLNAPKEIRKMWAEIKNHVDLPLHRIKAFEKLLDLDEVVSRSLNGQVISSILTKHLTQAAPPQLKLTPNVGNDFPDLYIGCGRKWDYSALPKRKDIGKDGKSKEYGAALVGESQRPVRVPDGIEVKTSPHTVKADCHYHHTGLHFVLVYRVIDVTYRVIDLKVAFLRPSDYVPRGRNTEATTVKYSFGGGKFISILPQTIQLPVVTPQKTPNTEKPKPKRKRSTKQHKPSSTKKRSGSEQLRKKKKSDSSSVDDE